MGGRANPLQDAAAIMTNGNLRWDTGVTSGEGVPTSAVDLWAA